MYSVGGKKFFTGILLYVFSSIPVAQPVVQTAGTTTNPTPITVEVILVEVVLTKNFKVIWSFLRFFVFYNF